jgi:hypothetical protein
MFANNTNISCPDVTIPSGSASSNIISRGVIGDAAAITLYAPAALDAHTYVIEVSRTLDATSSSTWSVLSNGVADITPPAAGKVTVYPFPNWQSFRIKDQSGNVAADRTWGMTKNA